MSEFKVSPFEKKHLLAVLEWVNDPEIQDAIGTIRPITLSQHERWYESLQTDDSRLYLVIEETKTGEHVGMIGLNSIDLRYRNAELWIYLGTNAPRRAGLGTSAVRQVFDLAFNNIGLHRLYVHVFDYNETALRFFEKCGFVREGLLRQAVLKRGAFHDKHVLGILAHEYLEGQQ
jgi:UDP-4-amino-4,6-dideoxy-N-acetyl-beta-L-altrosamine N-acetyltransferase